MDCSIMSNLGITIDPDMNSTRNIEITIKHLKRKSIDCECDCKSDNLSYESDTNELIDEALDLIDSYNKLQSQHDQLHEFILDYFRGKPSEYLNKVFGC